MLISLSRIIQIKIFFEQCDHLIELFKHTKSEPFLIVDSQNCRYTITEADQRAIIQIRGWGLLD